MKKKLLTTIISIITLILATTPLLGGCGGGKNDSDKFVEIQMYDRGYGTEGMRAVAEAYMEKNPEVTIEINGVVSNTLDNDIQVGPSAITTDMYFVGAQRQWLKIFAESCVIDGVSYPGYYEPLTDVYNFTPEGETKPIKEKMLAGVENYYNVKDGERWTEDTYYSATWQGGYSGIIYNEKMFEKYADNGWFIPNTTDELLLLCKKIIDTPATSENSNSKGDRINISAFMWSGADNYWGAIYDNWILQYDGKELYTDAINGIYTESNGEKSYSPKVARSDGRWETLILMDKLVGTCKEENGKIIKKDAGEIYCDSTLLSSNYTEIQSKFLYGEEARKNDNGATTSAMLPCGDWLENEMFTNFGGYLTSGKASFKFMKIPVISAIRNHSDCNGTIESDAELSALVKAIDSGSTALSGDGYSVDQKAFDRVYFARNCSIYSGSNDVYIPVFATAKEEAKNFLKYLYSDEALKLYTKVTRGQELPFNVDYLSVEGVSEIQKSKFEIMSKQIILPSADKNVLVYKGRFGLNAAYQGWENRFCVSSSTDYYSPETIFEGNYEELASRWDSILRDAGMD